ncbi:hypothetical protein [Albirhodobacter sp. R86504]|uniref:hypothetical protein n=1 Tax=Albirhodobacter sp. R86504 TaxID=3093848 RepID=UPI00367188AF
MDALALFIRESCGKIHKKAPQRVRFWGNCGNPDQSFSRGSGDPSFFIDKIQYDK